MRNNPVYGKDDSAGAELNWVDALMSAITKANADHGQGAYDFVDDYMDLFRPVTAPSNIAQLNTLKADKAFCQERFGSGT